MSVSITQLTTLVELWSRHSEPESYDVVRSVSLAQALETGPPSPPAVLALAYRLVQEVHNAVGWRLPENAAFSRCKSGLASVKHTCGLLIEEVCTQLASSEGKVALIGALGMSRSLFGYWDVLPAQGEVLVCLGDDRPDPRPSSPFSLRGVRRVGSGTLGDEALEQLRPAVINGYEVLVPSAELVSAGTNGQNLEPGDLESLVFCAAVYHAAQTDHWDRVLGLAEALGRGRAPVEAAMRLGITDWLGLSIGPITRLSVTLRDLLGRKPTALFSF